MHLTVHRSALCNKAMFSASQRPVAQQRPVQKSVSQQVNSRLLEESAAKTAKAQEKYRKQKKQKVEHILVQDMA